MYNFEIQFAYDWAPWLLLLLIPAVAVPLILHLRINKRYRRTRNRIISLVLHITIMVMAIFVLTGMTFTYEVDNPENEIILLVDVSDTQEMSKQKRDNFVYTVLNESQYDGFRVGVVTFGFTQNYAVPLTYDVDKIYDRYKEAALPDVSATDIASALRFTAELFENPKSSKIVVVTDGKETDERAVSAIGAITARGILVDTVYISSDYHNDYFQVVGVDFTEYHMNLNQPYDIDVNIRSKLDGQVISVELLDNGNANEENSVQKLEVSSGLNTVTFSKTFTTQGLHEIRVKIHAEDYLQQNNEYYSYIYLEVFDNILILERYEGESEALEELLTAENAGYNIETMNILTSDELPTSLDELRKYDQVILNNIANSDLPVGFDEMLYSYVYTYGGGLFTVGGSDEMTGEAHAYNRADMRNTLYQQMLPVQAIDYTPPVGVVIIVDISGSMDSDGGNGYTKRELAKQGAIACLEALTERDYVGVMTLDSVYGVVQPMTSTQYKSNIVAAIEGINGTGGTVFSDAISRAGQILTDLKSVDRRHIIIVTDGVPVDNDEETYLDVTQKNYLNNKITLSIVGIGIQENSAEAQKMETLVDKNHGNGRLHCVQGRPSDIALEMYEDLNVAEIKEVVPEPFNPIVSNELSTLFNDVEYGTDAENRRTMNIQLGGFYGVKVRADEHLILEGQYQVPIYAQWKLGAGSVGSFMCDLSGKWSSDFLTDGNGQRFLLNVISNLMPKVNIRPNEITANLVEENYINQLNVFAELDDNESISGEIVDTATGKSVSMNTAPDTENDSCYITMYLNSENGYSRCNFVIKQEGIYRIKLVKRDAAGNVKATYETYKSFSFSEEYNLYPKNTSVEPKTMLASLAERGNGSMIVDLEAPWEIFENFVTTIGHTFDPRWLFMITAMVLFLLDIAVRKFKFKWPHELYREYKQKKNAKSSSDEA